MSFFVASLAFPKSCLLCLCAVSSNQPQLSISTTVCSAAQVAMAFVGFARKVFHLSGGTENGRNSDGDHDCVDGCHFDSRSPRASIPGCLLAR